MPRLNQKRMYVTLMKTRLLKVLLGFQGLSLFENLGFPLAANHGRFDPTNEYMQPYIALSFFILIGFIFLITLIYKKPLLTTRHYNFAKIALPMIFITLIISVSGVIPMYWTIVSTMLFLVHIFGILLSLWLTIAFFLNKAII